MRKIASAWLIACALCDGAAATPGTPGSLGAPTLAIAAARPAAGAHATRRPAGRPSPSPGQPPGPGYCWYYVDRSTRAPGFWDLCRER